MSPSKQERFVDDESNAQAVPERRVGESVAPIKQDSETQIVQKTSLQQYPTMFQMPKTWTYHLRMLEVKVSNLSQHNHAKIQGN